MQERGDTEISEEKPRKIGFPPAVTVIRGHIYQQEQVNLLIYPSMYRWKITIWNDLGKFICYFMNNPDCSNKSPVRIMGLSTTYDLGKGSIMVDCKVISYDQHQLFKDFIRNELGWDKKYESKYQSRKKEASNEED